MIEIKNLTKKYGNNIAIDNLSFTIEDGKIYGLLGPNGAGKSTTMNIITGCLAPTDGSVTICGYDILNNPVEAKKCIGYLPEIPPIYPEMTPYEYLFFVAEAKGIEYETAHRQVREVIELTQLESVKNRLIRNLSKGYRQRIGIAQAMLGNPDIIILDEPTVGLDPKQIIEIRDLIARLGRNHTIILSSHILSEIQAVCERVIIINRGKLVADDTPTELSKKLSNDHSVVVRAGGEKEELTKILSSVKDVKKVVCLGKKEENTLDFVVTPEKDCDIRREISARLAERKRPLIPLFSNELTLEQVFMRLTYEADIEEGKK